MESSCRNERYYCASLSDIVNGRRLYDSSRRVSSFNAAVTEYFEKRDRIIDRKKIQNEKDTNYIACYVPIIRL